MPTECNFYPQISNPIRVRPSDLGGGPNDGLFRDLFYQHKMVFGYMYEKSRKSALNFAPRGSKQLFPTIMVLNIPTYTY